MTSTFCEEFYLMDGLNIGDALRQFRRKKDLTQAKIAERLGLKRTTYTSYEQGLAIPPDKVIAQLRSSQVRISPTSRAHTVRRHHQRE